MEDQYLNLFKQIFKLNLTPEVVDFGLHVHKFQTRDLVKIRSLMNVSKGRLSVKNIYNKEPKYLNNKTIASFQVNVSNLLSPSHTLKEITYPARYGVVDVYTIVRNLDEEFKEEIKSSGRQPGMYAIKDSIRLEYRSLPNFVFNRTSMDVIERIRRCVE